MQKALNGTESDNSLEVISLLGTEQFDSDCEPESVFQISGLIGFNLGIVGPEMTFPGLKYNKSKLIGPFPEMIKNEATGFVLMERQSSWASFTSLCTLDEKDSYITKGSGLNVDGQMLSGQRDAAENDLWARDSFDIQDFKSEKIPHVYESILKSCSDGIETIKNQFNSEPDAMYFKINE